MAVPTSKQLPLITVVTPTKYGEESLIKAITSVQRQDYAGPIEHVIVGDGIDVSRFEIHSKPMAKPPRYVRCVQGPPPPSDYRMARIANVLNHGVAIGNGVAVSFLGDDNSYEPNHISSLYELIDKGAEAAYAWRRIYYPDDRPFLEKKAPWVSNPEESKNRFDELVKIGNRIPGDNIAMPHHENNKPECVDGNLWMIKMPVMRQFQWKTQYTAQEKIRKLSEDRDLTTRLIEAGVRIERTEQPTVRYYLEDSGITRTAGIEAAATATSINLSTPSVAV